MLGAHDEMAPAALGQESRETGSRHSRYALRLAADGPVAWGGWKYIIGQGLWFWFLIAASQVLQPFFKKAAAVLRINTDCFSWHLFQSLRVFALVSIGNMFFRLDGFVLTLKTMKAGFHWNPWVLTDGSLFRLGLDGRQFFVMGFGLALLAAVSCLREKGRSVRKWLAEQNLAFQCLVLVTLTFLVFMIGMYGTYSEQGFMYQKF